MKVFLFKSLVLVVLIYVFLCVSFFSPLMAQAVTEDTIKALYIVKIVKFIKWDTENITVCTLGEGEASAEGVGASLHDIVSKKKNSSVVVKRNIKSISSKHCSILYIDQELASDLRDVFIVTNQKGIITMSDINGFAHKGGMIGFIRDKRGRVRVEMNYSNFKKAGHKISAELLEIIKVIR